jgi:lysophospholipase L1-like esterase
MNSLFARYSASLLAGIGIAAVSGSLLMAQAAPAGQAAQASTPRLRAAADPNRWEPTIQKFEEADRVSPVPRNEIVFVGSSSIVRWDLKQYFPEFGPKAINRGFGGSLLADSVKYAERIVIPYKPRIVVLYAGDNDIGGGAKPAQVAALFTRFVQKVHGALPQTKIVFISIKPSIQRWAMINEIRESNRLIKDYISKNKGLVYVDIDPQSIGPDGKPRPELLVEDGLHLTPEGYKIWTAALKPHLD